MKSETYDVDTSDRRLVDLTQRVTDFCSGHEQGLCNIFVPHATVGVAIFEVGAGSDEDVLMSVEALLPRDGRWAHQHGSPGHGADHVLPAFISPSVTVPVLGGRPALGTWQSIVLVDTNRDNPIRHVRLSLIDG